MNHMHRRAFLGFSAAAAGAGLASPLMRSARAQPMGANNAVRIAVIGLNGQAFGNSTHIRLLTEIPGVRLVGVCDVDPRILAREVEKLKTIEGQGPVFATTDARKIMERSDIDAITIATCNHWHALLTVWACQAGKDVYVEKPVSHTVWEGRKMIEAAAKYGRVVQAGTQRRSDFGWADVIQYLKEGHLGKIRWIHGLNFKLRDPWKRKLPWYPDWLDYDMYCGPAPMTPLEREKLHYDWHFSWATGNGDLANLGVHQMDIARWISGLTMPPRRVLSLGGRFLKDDASETPNTQVTIFDYDGLPFLFENRGLPAKPGVRYQDQVRGLRQGLIVQCEGGYYAGDRGGAAYDNKGAQIKKFPGEGGRFHMKNFVDTVRSRRTRDLAAPIEIGHGSTASCLYGNISYRVGRASRFDAARKALEGIAPAVDALDRMKEHLAVNGVDLEKQPLTLGRWLQIDGADGIAGVESGDESELARARYLLRETHRPPYVIPEEV
jgi:predicted dehydrogenase